MFRSFVIRSFVMLLMCWSVRGRAQQSPVAQTPNTTSTDAVPRLIKFSGILKDEAGKPRGGVGGITFALYREQEGGAPLWLETQNVQADATGHYSVSLGAMQPSGLPTDVFVSGEARWLAIQPEGQAEQPRVLLMSVPYALKAADAETIGGLPPSAFVRAPEPSANSTPALSGPANSASLPAASVTGSGNTSFLPIWKTSTSLGNSTLFESGGKLGIGTTSPALTLDVNGSGVVRGNQNVTGSLGVGTTPPAGSFRLQVTTNNQLGALVQGPFSGVGAGLDLQTAGTGGKQWEILATGKTAAQGAGKLNIRDVSDGRDVFTIDTSDTTNVAGLSVAGTSVFHGLASFASGQTFPGVPLLNAANNFTTFQAATGDVAGFEGFSTGSGQFDTGVLGMSNSATGATEGVIGLVSSPQGIGVLGEGIGESSVGMRLIGCCSAGVWGDIGSTAGGATALAGTADDARAIYLENNSPSGVPTAFMQQDATLGFALEAGGGLTSNSCVIDAFGHENCPGGFSSNAAVDSGARQVALYSMQSPQNWSEDFGRGRLSSGLGEITIDSTFAQTVNLDANYHVFLTPVGECRGLYVTNETATGFEVHEIGGGQSNVAFDYRIVALRRGFENLRLANMTEQLKKLDAYSRIPRSGPGVKLPLPSSPGTHVAPAKMTAQR